MTTSYGDMIYLARVRSCSTRARFGWKPLMTSPSITSVAVVRLCHVLTSSSRALGSAWMSFDS
jgi:hypothetical protein